MQTVVVILPAKSGEKDLLFIHLWIELQIVVDVRIENHTRSGRDIDPIAEHSDAERRNKVCILNEHGGLIRLSVAVGIFEHYNPVTLRVLNVHIRFSKIAIVDRLGHPDSALVIDVHVRRIVEHG